MAERGAAEGERERTAEPHPITRSFLAGREAGKSAFSLSFINLTTCAKSPATPTIQPPLHVFDRLRQTDTERQKTDRREFDAHKLHNEDIDIRFERIFNDKTEL
ncbi:uncharacterized protein V6R79_019899 [Siganus canaliculatus]